MVGLPDGVPSPPISNPPNALGSPSPLPGLGTSPAPAEPKLIRMLFAVPAAVQGAFC